MTSNKRRALKLTGFSRPPDGLSSARDHTGLTGAQDVAICEYPLKKDHGFAGYLLYVDGAAVGVIEQKKASRSPPSKSEPPNTASA